MYDDNRFVIMRNTECVSSFLTLFIVFISQQISRWKIIYKLS